MDHSAFPYGSANSLLFVPANLGLLLSLIGGADVKKLNIGNILILYQSKAVVPEPIEKKCFQIFFLAWKFQTSFSKDGRNAGISGCRVIRPKRCQCWGHDGEYQYHPSLATVRAICCDCCDCFGCTSIRIVAAPDDAGSCGTGRV